MKNQTQDGEILTVVAPYALASGEGFLVGSIFLVACSAAAAGASVEGKTEGVFDLTTLSTDTPAQGAKAYWDSGNKRVTSTVGSNVLIGAFAAAKANGVAVGSVYVDGVIR